MTKKKQPTERETIDAMRTHGFMFHHVPERDRYTMIFSRKLDARGRMNTKLTAGVRVILTVPAAGELGRELVAAFKKINAKKKRDERKKAKRAEVREARRVAKIERIKADRKRTSDALAVKRGEVPTKGISHV